MTPDFEKVSVLKNSDVTYSSVSIPMLRASLKPEPVGWLDRAGHYSATHDASHKHAVVRLFDYKVNANRLLKEVEDERRLRRDHVARIHQLVEALTSLNSELVSARIKIDDLQSDVELVTAHGADQQAALDTSFDLLKYAYNHSKHLPNEQDVDRFLTAHGR